MIKIILGYILAIYVGNTLAAFAHLPLLGITTKLGNKGGFWRFISGVIPATTVSLISVVICVLILKVFSIEPNNYLVWILFCTRMFNGLRRLQTRKWSESEFGYIAGDALGIFLGTLIFDLPY